MEELIKLETAQKAKEKGFCKNTPKVYVETLEHTLEMGRGGDCDFPYHPPRILDKGNFNEWDIIHCNAPSQSVLAEWLREEHNIDVFLDSVGGKNGYYYVLQYIDSGNQIKTGDTYHTFEEAFELGLSEALNLLEYTN